MNVAPTLLVLPKLLVCILLPAFALVFHRIVILGSWYVIALLLGWVWFANVYGHPARFTCILVAVILGYFILEGVEIAVTQLSDKDTSQFTDIRVGRLIDEIKANRALFYDAREWIIVGLAVLLTIESDFRPLKLPFLSALSRFEVTPTVFNVLFTTFVLVWLAQAPSKRLASGNSEGFLIFCHFQAIWPVVKLCGVIMEQIRLHRLSDQIVGLFGRSKLLSLPRNLRPSDSAYFMYSLRIYGYAYLRHKDEILIKERGAARYLHRGVLYVSSNDRVEFPKRFYFDAESRVVHAHAQAFFAPDIGERLTSGFETAIDAILAGETPVGRQFTKCEFPVYFDHRSSGQSKDGYDHNFTLTTSVQLGDVPDDSPVAHSAVAIRFEVLIEVNESGFKLPIGNDSGSRVRDCWIRQISFPWSQFDLSVSLDDGVTGYLRSLSGEDSVTILDLQNKRESGRISSSSLSARSIRKSCLYPLTGGVCRLAWEVWPSNGD
ncbi:MAG TPA: hypothetical protein VGD64_00635 [Acidisarcina sp.]